MSNKKLMKKVLIISLSATMAFAAGKSVYASTQALPNGTIKTKMEQNSSQIQKVRNILAGLLLQRKIGII